MAFLRLFVGIAALGMVGCATVPTPLDPNVYYRRDMEINGRKGVAVLARRDLYKLKLKSQGKMDLLTVSTCHREDPFYKVGYEYEYEYKPVEGLESGGYCPMQVGGFNRTKGRHAWAFVDFEGPDATLPARLKCNGVDALTNGVSVCQSRVGLEQEILFDVAVKTLPEARCPMPGDGKRFQFSVVLGECVFAFREVAAPNRVHRLTTIGYEQILIPEE